MSGKKVWFLAKVILAVTLVGVVVSKLQWEQVRALLHRIELGWFALSAGAFVLMSLLKAGQYYVLIGGERVSYGKTVRTVIWQNAISNFIGTGVGIASYMTMLKVEQDVSLARSGVAFIITKFGDLLAIFLYLVVSAAVVWQEIVPLQWLTAVLSAMLLSGIAVFLLTVIWKNRFVDWVVGVCFRLRLTRFAIVEKGLNLLNALAQENRQSVFDRLRIGILLSVLYMTATMGFALSGMRTFGVPVDAWAVIYVSALIQLVSFVPVQILGGLGVSEMTVVYLYGFFGIDQGEMAAVALGQRFVLYLLTILSLLYLPLDSLLYPSVVRDHSDDD